MISKALVGASAPGRLTAIDGLRAIAALTVCLFHFHNTISNGRAQIWPEPFQTLADNGVTGVQIFFVLSGFVIAHSVRNEKITGGFFGRFALRRSLRLDPAYWAMIIISAVVMWGVKHEFPSASTILLNMLYLDNIVGAPSLVKVGWTLALEIQFYLIYVGLIAAWQRFPATKYLFAPLALLSIGVCIRWIPFPFEGLFLGNWNFFFLGALVSWVLQERASSRWLFALIAIELLTFTSRGLVGALTALAIFGMSRRGTLGTALAHPVLQFLGRISYSLYLVHPLVANRPLRRLVIAFDVPPTGLTAIGLMLVATVVGVAVSTVFYLLFEHPSLELSRKIRPRGEVRVAPVVAPGGAV